MSSAHRLGVSAATGGTGGPGSPCTAPALVPGVLRPPRATEPADPRGHNTAQKLNRRVKRVC
jgi:hypothetical protein